ncbi:unnamed protein product [Schistosoma mattheei]|uniref:Carbonic anhydrase n=1 Tax=Schistosoma mattheei TaxID=31246 RepID=A0AA85B3B3_9TREM|nr:unnamed protein product [Schistosoma mattheei]
MSIIKRFIEELYSLLRNLKLTHNIATDIKISFSISSLNESDFIKNLKSHVNKQSFLDQLKAFNEKPNILAAVISCVDSRVLTSKLLCSNVGELFIERNPGNFICCENSSLEHFNKNCVTPGFLELT